MEAIEKLLLIAVGLIILASFLYWAIPYFGKIDNSKKELKEYDENDGNDKVIKDKAVEKDLFSIISKDLLNQSFLFSKIEYRTSETNDFSLNLVKSLFV